MNLKILKEYAITRIQEFIRVMTESINTSDGVFIMSVFALQRCSLLFNLDQFGNNAYSDFKLQIICYLTNWSTFQTPLYIINIKQLREATIYTICIVFWLSALILFINFNLKRNLTSFFTYYQLLIVIPAFEVTLLHLFKENDIFLGTISLLAIIINYLIQFIVHRNYQLPQKNYFIRRYSYYNLLLIFADIGAMITKYYISEILQTVVFISQNVLFMIDSFYIQPYQYSINKEYMAATSMIFCFSIIKLFAFFMGQDEIFFILLLLTPLFTVSIQKFHTKIIYKQLFNENLNYQQLLIVSDIITNEKTNPILINSIIINLRQKHKFSVDPDNLPMRIQQTILLLFNTQLEIMKHQNDKYQIESLQLYKIMYITITCKRTQLGYIELKTFETNSIKQSFYFNVISLFLQEKMANINSKITSQKNEKRLSLSNIRRAELLYEENLNKIIKVIDTKIKFWLDLNKGYQKIEDLAKNTIILSEKIWEIRDEFFYWFKIDPFKLQSQLSHYNAQELKLLGILYSTILNDYHATLDIELRIDEIMSYERNLQTENITNSTLLNDELIMIATSFAKQRGLMLNKNRAQIANFFGYADEKEFQNITQIEQLMPTYIRQIHDKIIARYMRKGYSMLTEQAKEVYIKMKNNFIKAANISLLHMFENDTDYIITGALQKVKQGQDFIIFDRSGKILGITEEIFSILGQLTLEQLLSKGHIYFWFHNIFNEIVQSKQELLQQQDQFAKAAGKQQIIYPIKGFQQICQDHDFSRANSTVKNQDSGNYFLTELNDTEQIGVSFANINSCHFLKEQNLQFMNDFAMRIRQNNQADYLSPYQIRYTIQFSVLGNDILPIFIMQITEIEKKRSATSHTSGAQSIKSLFQQSSEQDPFNENKFDVDAEIEGEKQQSININPPIINKINNSLNPNSNIEEIQQYPNYSSEQYKLISPRGNNKENLINEFYEDEEEEKNRCQENNKSSSQIEKKKNIAEIMHQNQNNQDLYIVDNAKQSQSSSTSDRTQISVFNILRNLQYTNRYQTTLIKVFINTILLICLLTLLIILELVISRTNTNTLQQQIPLIRIPDKFNRLYCTFAIIGQMDLEMKLLKIDYGVYYAHRINSEGDKVRPQMLALVADIQNKFSRYDLQGKLEEAQIKIISQYLYLVQNISLIQFCEMVDDYTQALNSFFTQDSEETLIQEQVKLIFLKGNLISLINLISNLVENIVTEFFDNINNFELIYLVFLFLQLAIIVTAILFQFRFWADPYIYKQNILLLICRVPEKEIELLQLKYKSFRDLLEFEICKWKQTNYFKEFFSCRVSQLKKIQKMQLLSVTKKVKKAGVSRVTVNSRIQETQYSILHIYLMLLFFWLLLTSLAFSSYLFQNLNIQNSQPELNLCMQFVRFKQEFDSCMIISQFIKNQPLLSNYQKKSGIYQRNPEYNKSDGFFKTYTSDLIKQFSESLESGKILYQNIYDNIVASNKISESNKNVLLGLYQDDLCDYIEDELPFCNYENGQFKYFPDYPEPLTINNNRERLRQGFNGIYQQILSLFSSKYSNELNGIEVTEEYEVMQFLETPEYIQLLLPYFYDLNKAIIKFYVTIINASVDILEIDYQNYLAYYVTYSIVAQLMFFVIVVHQAMKIQRQVRAIRQALVLLPHESLLDIQIYSAIKRFEQQM